MINLGRNLRRFCGSLAGEKTFLLKYAVIDGFRGKSLGSERGHLELVGDYLEKGVSVISGEVFEGQITLMFLGVKGRGEVEDFIWRDPWRENGLVKIWAIEEVEVGGGVHTREHTSALFQLSLRRKPRPLVRGS